MSSSDSDEDVPLSKLREQAPKVAAKRTIIDDDDDSDEDKPIVAMRKKVKKSSNSDDDDDQPISAFKKKPTIKSEPKIKSDPKSSAAKNTMMKEVHVKQEVKIEKRTLSASTKSSRKVAQIAFKQQECSEALYDTLKGRLVQELLCRWWYALDWPPKDTKYEETADLQPLDGFTGAFISVKGENMGSIVDKRSCSGKPSFMTFFAMPAKEVQDLVVVAYKNQMRVLEQHEGSDAPLLHDLKGALRGVEKIDAEKAEKGGLKVLKSFTEVAKRLRDL
ncbi:hypothetical protein ACHHYP_01560 [Achlya hypogyna]|uniref:Uncharacterized protein n=1 Tax=Achlya hypogyna TaxID=1202772 RepID=A0A1V9Z8F4_ACHHY|nr:hypothetical protein ACHHYP_01560 [Achlya hypogyna]